MALSSKCTDKKPSVLARSPSNDRHEHMLDSDRGAAWSGGHLLTLSKSRLFIHGISPNTEYAHMAPTVSQVVTLLASQKQQLGQKDLMHTTLPPSGNFDHHQEIGHRCSTASGHCFSQQHRRMGQMQMIFFPTWINKENLNSLAPAANLTDVITLLSLYNVVHVWITPDMIIHLWPTVHSTHSFPHKGWRRVAACNTARLTWWNQTSTSTML